jgi:hypothetical protein
VGKLEKFTKLRRSIVQGVHLKVVEHFEKDCARGDILELLNTLRALHRVH